MKAVWSLMLVLGSVLVFGDSAFGQCPTCGNGVVDGGETSANCPQDIPHAATCTSPCGQPGSFEATAGLRQALDFSGTTTWSTAGLPAGWVFAGAPTPTTAGALPAADAYGAKAGLIQPNCSGSCVATNGFCIGNLASNQAVGAGGANGKLGANFDGRPNVAANLSYAVLRGQNSPTLVSETYNMSAVTGFKIQLWLFPSETSCGQANSWGSCVGNLAFIDFSSNGGTSWNSIINMNLSSSNSDMCTNNNTNTLWLRESAWSRVCITVFRTSTAAGNFYTVASSSSAASGIMVNSAFFTSTFKYRVRYSQTASCTSGITTTNPGRYLAIDYPVITSGNEMIPCGISFANLCGYGADANDDGVGSSTLTTNTIAHGLVRRSVNQAERGVEILTSQNASFASQNLSGSTFATNFDLCNAEGGDKQCIDWQTNNNFYLAVYECITDWEAPTGASGINVQYYKGTTAQSTGMTKVTAAGKTAAIGWRYSGNRFLGCGGTSDLNPGCNGYAFVSGSLPTQFARGFYQLGTNSTGQSWSFYGASSCLNYFNGPFFAPVAVPDTLSGSGNYTFCNGSNELVFTGLSRFCQDPTGFSGSGSILVTGPNGFSETITSGGQGVTPIVDPGVYVVTAQIPTSPSQCVNCSRVACITVTLADITDCTTPLAIPGLSFWGKATQAQTALLEWSLQRTGQANAFVVERSVNGSEFEDLERFFAEPGDRKYQYLDESPVIGSNEYRLRMEDNSGQLHVSESVMIHISAELTVGLWPNPAKDQLNFRIGFDAESYRMDLYDFSGKKVREWKSDQVEGVLDLAGLPTGAYLLRVSGAGHHWTGRVMHE